MLDFKRAMEAKRQQAQKQSPMKTADGQTADMICAEFGPITIQFPIFLFETLGALEYRRHRHNFVTSMLALYDKVYDDCRAKLNEADPLTLRPKHEAPLHVMFVDASVVEDAVAVDEPDAIERAAAGDDLEIDEPPVAEKEEIDGKADDQAGEQGEVAPRVGSTAGGEDPGVEVAQERE